MLSKIALTSLWIGFVIYAFFFAPPNRPDTVDTLIDLSTGKWGEINPIVVSLFNIMGIWPIIYTALLLVDGRGQKIRAWPFAVASFGVGAFAILPYLIFRQPHLPFTGEKNRVIRFWESRWWGVICAVGISILFAYALVKGDWSDFIQQWRHDRFINVMSLDFCCLVLLFPILLKDDLTRRDWKNPTLFRALSRIPALGPALYLIVRPSLPDNGN